MDKFYRVTVEGETHFVRLVRESPLVESSEARVGQRLYLDEPRGFVSLDSEWPVWPEELLTEITAEEWNQQVDAANRIIQSRKVVGP